MAGANVLASQIYENVIQSIYPLTAPAVTTGNL
jgi:hypothetical protein